VKLNLVTDYPWQGQIKLRVVETGNSPWILSLRIPEWSQRPVLSMNGDIVENLNLEKGYLVLDRTWQAGDSIDLDLGMEPMLVVSNPRIDATRDCLAVQRGPIVYCLEDRDQEIKGHLLDVEIDKKCPLAMRWEDDLLEGVMAIEAQGQFVDRKTWRGRLYQPATFPDDATVRPARLIAIPYYAWGNRGMGGMRVWIPKKSS
jgi:DUF1680 family protein